jgi:hypothetical protein
MTCFSGEIFKAVNGFSGYEISNLGRLFSLKSNKFLKARITKKGYEQVALRKDGKAVEWRVHQLVAKHFISNMNNYKEINHIDNNPLNNRFDNLQWCTRKMNMDHCLKQGRMFIPHVQGEQHPDSIVTNEIVLEVRKLHEEGMSKRDIATKMNLQYKHVGKLVRREIWRHI